jgi:RHH-type proline utilization regulon transcriptional repressor/proline dehydrogenase/delta 1-pyrroline-5-carboxylate dehydrogenase
MKAGGPNYVVQLMDFTDVGSARVEGLPTLPTLRTVCEGLRAGSHPEAERIIAAALSYERDQREEFGVEHDHFKLVGQDNVRRYLSLGSVRVRVHADDSAFDIFARACAAHAAGCAVVISVPPGLNSPSMALLESLTESWAGAIEFVEETDAQLARAIRERRTDRVRYAAPDRVSLEVLQAGNTAGGIVVSVPVSVEGRMELLWYVHEQSISTDYHRYGNLGLRSDETRAEVL